MSRMSLENVEVQAKNPASTKRKEQRKRKNEILDIRQKIYIKLKEGKTVFSIMKIFKSKVEKFLKDYRTDLSYDDEKSWRDKVIITEKAVVRRANEIKALRKCSKCEDKNTVPNVKELFDNVKAQEDAIENLPEPPQVEDVDEIERRLENLKKFNKKSQIKKGEGKKKAKKENAGINSNDVDSIDVKVLNDKLMYKQVHDGESNEARVDNDMGMDASNIIPLLQAIFAMLLVTGKTVHEQSLQISRLSKLSRPSLLSQLHPEASLSPRSACSCQTTPRVCCKVTNAFTEKVSGMVNAASSGMLWFKQIYGAFEWERETTVRAAKVRLVSTMPCDRPRLDTLQLADEDYKVKVKVHYKL